jgi:hypothetical protein
VKAQNTATCDFEMDRADKDKKIDMPLLLLASTCRHQSTAA